MIKGGRRREVANALDRIIYAGINFVKKRWCNSLFGNKGKPRSPRCMFYKNLNRKYLEWGNELEFINLLLLINTFFMLSCNLTFWVISYFFFKPKKEKKWYVETEPVSEAYRIQRTLLTKISSLKLKKTIGILGSASCNFSKSGSSCVDDTNATHYIAYITISILDIIIHYTWLVKISNDLITCNMYVCLYVLSNTS